ncbi:MAG: hypothetical protein LWW77_04295 [Propionibacteriales bacterium]|nr:hypothetical protein [Propionibacteriales bacterium]
MSEVPPQVSSIIAGPKPSDFINNGCAAPEPPAAEAAPFDPLRLCIFATISMLGWLFGPLAVVVFAAVGFAGYWTARKAGLTRSKCYLRDTRLVLAYLGLFMLAGLTGLGFQLARWLGWN